MADSTKTEAEVIAELVKALKKTPIVTLAGKGGAYDFIKQYVEKLKASENS